MTRSLHSWSDAARQLALLTCAWMLGSGASAQLTVASQSNLQQLAADITGPGVHISNPSITCHTQGYGTYSYSGSGMDLSDGVLLTSGRIVDAIGPNNAGNISFQAGTSGDPLLNNVTGRTTRDACKFEFDIIPSGDSLRFDFTFASEEYNEWVGSEYNDVFGFFISGPGITGDPGAGINHNIALVPGTVTPVTINNVNNASNAAYYQDNTGGTETQYDGYTQDLYAEAVVQPCQTYHLKLIIADATDRKYDSGVFIEKIYSPSINMITYTVNGTPNMIEGCNMGWVRFTRDQVMPTPLTLQYYIHGNAINGSDYATIAPVDPLLPKIIVIPANESFVEQPVVPLSDGISEPTEYLKFILGNPNCPGQTLDTLHFNISDSLLVAVSPGGTICSGGSWPLTATGGVNYAWTPATGLSCATCPNPVASPTSTTTYTVTISHGACSRTMSRQVRVSDLTLSATVTHPLCSGGTNGAINLSVNNGLAPYTCSWTGPGGFTSSAEDITNLAPGTYTATVTDAGCTRTASYNVIAPASLGVTLTPAILPFGQNIACFGGNTGSIDATINGGTGPYTTTWSGPGGYASSNVDISGLVAGAYSLNVTDANGCTASASTTLIQTSQVFANITSANPVDCFNGNDGSATVSASGGIPPYTYSWNTSPVQNTATATGLAPGSYTVTVTDGYNCTATTVADISGPTAALATNLTSLINVLCFGNSTGSASIVITGGTPPYSTSWNTAPVQNGLSAVNLPAGTWTATVTDANGCTVTRTVTITQPASTLSAVLFAQQNVNCQGNSNGSATVNASGGTGPYTYSWNTSPLQNTATAINLPAGSYTCTVQDVNLCSTSVNVTITQPAALFASISAQNNVMCFGDGSGDASAFVTGGTSPYSYSWNTSPVQTTATATALSAGTWTCTVTDALGCVASNIVTITQPSQLVLSGTVDAANCQGAADGGVDITPAGGTGSYDYSWTGPAGFTATTQDISSVIAGGYVVVVTDANGCTATATYDVNQPGLFSISAVLSDHNGAAISCPGANDGAIDLSVSGATGPYVFSWIGPGGFVSTDEDVTGLVAGTYVITITDANGCSTSQNYVLSAPAPASISLSAPVVNGVNIGCAGGNTGGIDATISGGVAPFSMAWSGPGGFVSANEDINALAAGTYTLITTDANGCMVGASTTLNEPSPLSGLVVSTTDATCFGSSNGQVTVAGSGGIAPYAYSWNTFPLQSSATASGLTAGTYTATITDANGCTVNVIATISGPSAPLQLNVVDVVDVLCHDDASGAATVSATGGSSPYTYTWNTTPPQTGATATGLAAGTYTVTVTDASGCAASSPVTVTQPIIGVWAYVESYQDETCYGANDGWATLEVGGGSGSWTIEWNTLPPQFGATATGLAPGFYTVTITDNNGCDTPKQFPVPVDGPAAPLVISSSTTSYNGTAVSCPGATDGGINATITGGVPGYTSTWTGPGGYTGSTEDIYGLAAGTYDLLVTDANGCTAAASIDLGAPVPISAVANTTTTTCAGVNNGAVDVTVNDGVAPYSYTWNGPGGYSATTEDISGLAAGVYALIVTDANGCTGSFFFDVNEPGVFNVTAVLSAYIGGSNVSCAASSDGAIDLSTSGGTAPYSLVWTGPGGFSANTEDLSGLVAGTYDLTLTDANGCGTLAQYTLVAPAALTASLAPFVHPSGGNISCSGASDGAIDATIGGGTPGFVLAWSGPGGFTANTEDLTGLIAGDHTLTVWDVNGCSTTTTTTLLEAPALNASISISQYNSGDAVSCNGGSNGIIDLAITGGLAPYGVSWTGPGGFTSIDQDLSGLAAGDYDVLITDAAGCTTTATATLTEPGAITLTTTTSDFNGFGVSCSWAGDGSIDLNVIGGAGNFTWQWTGPNAFVSTDEDISGLVVGTYIVIATDMNGCSISTSVTLDAPSPINATAAITTVGCQGAADGAIDLTVTGGVGPYTFAWNGPGGYNATSEDLGSVFAGVYHVVVTGMNGCTFSQDFDVNQPGLFNINALITTYAGGYNVSCADASNGAIDLGVSGGTGPYFFFWSGPDAFTAITEDISGLLPGTYDLTLTDQNGCTLLASYTLTAPTAINIGLVASQFAGGANVGCPGSSDGDVDAIIIGGVAPYSIQWSGPNGFLSISEDITALEAGTYAITVIDAVGCTISTTIDLTEPDPIEIAVTASAYSSGGGISCDGASDGSIDLTLTGGSLLYNIQWNGPNGFASNNADIGGLEAGSYDVVVSDANGCTATASVTLNGPTPVDIVLVPSQYSGGFAIGCSGDATGTVDAMVTGGTGPYDPLWTGPAGFTSTSEDLVGVAAGDYTLVVTDSTGCSAALSITLAEPTPLDLSGIPSDAGNGYQIGCSGDDGSIDITVTGGNAPYVFDWTGSGGFASLSEDLTGLGAGTYAITVIDENGCTLSASYDLTQAGSLNASLAVSGNVCDGLDDGAINVTVSGGVAPFSFDWSGPGGFISTSEDISGLSGGDYTVTITDAGSCTVQQTATISSSASLNVSAFVSYYNGLNIPCAGDSSGVIGVTITGGTAPLDFIWSGPGSFASSATYLTGLIAGDYTLSITDVNGCGMDTTITLVGPASPLNGTLDASLFLSGTNISCFGAADGMIDLTPSGGSSPYTFDWRASDSTTYYTEDLSGLLAGTYDLVVTDANMCAWSTSITLDQPASGIVANTSLSDFNGWNTSCAGMNDGSVDLNATGGNGGFTYAWSGPGGFASNSQDLNGLSSGSYSVTITDINGCMLTLPVEVIGPQPLTAVIDPLEYAGGANISCAGVNDGVMNALINGGTADYTLFWTGPGGFASNNPSLADLAPGSYCLEVTDANGCYVEQCIDLIAPAPLTLDATSMPAACGADDGSIDLSVSGGSGTYSYEWANGSTSQDLSGLIAGDHLVHVTDANGCEEYLTVTVSGSTGVEADAAVTHLACNGSDEGAIDLSILAGTAPFTFTWSNGTNTEDLADLAAGGYAITITDANGCSWSNSYVVNDGAILTVDSIVYEYANGFNVSSFNGSDGTITVTPGGGAAPYDYDWSNGANTAMVNGLVAGGYSVTITDANGCSITLSFLLDQPTDLMLPTGFSPNGDGHNDFYVIQGLDAFATNQLVVFNRWGNVVFEQLNYRNDWDGDNLQGQPLPNGTYFVIVRINPAGNAEEADMTLQNYVDLRR